MDTNRHERFDGEAALECGGFDAAFGNQTPCGELLESLACLVDK
jgi:hypothetical protein